MSCIRAGKSWSCIRNWSSKRSRSCIASSRGIGIGCIIVTIVLVVCLPQIIQLSHFWFLIRFDYDQRGHIRHQVVLKRQFCGFFFQLSFLLLGLRDVRLLQDLLDVLESEQFLKEPLSLRFRINSGLETPRSRI